MGRMTQMETAAVTVGVERAVAERERLEIQIGVRSELADVTAAGSGAEQQSCATRSVREWHGGCRDGLRGGRGLVRQCSHCHSRLSSAPHPTRASSP